MLDKIEQLKEVRINVNFTMENGQQHKGYFIADIRNFHGKTYLVITRKQEGMIDSQTIELNKVKEVAL